MTTTLPSSESLTVEFKSDRTRLGDSALIEAVVCMANAKGGQIWLGVEDNGDATGLHKDHRQLAGLEGLPIDSLIALASLRETRRLSAEELAHHIHRDAHHAKRTLEALIEAGMVDAHGGTPRTRSYTLSAKVYRAANDRAAFTRQAGFYSIQQENMVMNYVRQHGEIRRGDVVELCRITDEQAKQILKKLKADRLLLQHGIRKGAYYTAGPGPEESLPYI